LTGRGHESLVLQDAETVGSALAKFQLKHALSLSECLVLEIARKAGISRWQRLTMRWRSLTAHRSCDARRQVK
jgi:hypothetical protein